MRPALYFLGIFLVAAGARNVWHGHAWAIPLAPIGILCLGMLSELPRKRRSW